MNQTFVTFVNIQVVSAIACIELPRGGWPDVISTLLTALAPESQASELQKVASLESIGYVCDGVV